MMTERELSGRAGRLDGILSPQAKNSVDHMGCFHHTKSKTLLKGCHTTTKERMATVPGPF
jgi:hypothetical protein